MTPAGNPYVTSGSLQTTDERVRNHQFSQGNPPQVQHSSSIRRSKKLPFLPQPLQASGPRLEFASASRSFLSSPYEHEYSWSSDPGLAKEEVMARDARVQEQRELSKKRSQYFEDVFAYREAHLSAQERISRDSMVLADIRTNVIIKDEYTVITDISYQLSTRYQRPESSIIVTITHSACLLYGGSFDPAYVVTITALASQLQPVTNKRNATLLQPAIEEILGVRPDRGVIRFVPMTEENLATNLKTVAGEIEDLEKEKTEEGNILKKCLSKATIRNKTIPSAKSVQNLHTSRLPTHEEQQAGFGAKGGWTVVKPSKEVNLSGKRMKYEKDEVSAKGLGRRRSFIAAIFRRGA